jgi:biopolymer transport protein ExbD
MSNVQQAGDIPPGINQLPDPQQFASEGGVSAKRRKRREVLEPEGLTITSLMDIMTIILVFLLKSYSSNPVQLPAAKDLKLPFSVSEIMPAESTTVTLTLSSIMVDDEKVLNIDNGEVSESDRSSGGFLIDPLFQKLQEAVDHQKRIAKFNKETKFTEVVTIIADRHVPFSLLSQVMYTAGQAQFSKFKFAVIKRSPT